MKNEYELNPMAYPGIHPVLRHFFLEAKNQKLFDNINAEIERYGGIVRYRDMIILENTTYHCEEYRLAKNRYKANTYREKRTYWTKAEDRYLLEHISNGALWLSYKMTKSESAIRHRVRYLDGK